MDDRYLYEEEYFSERSYGLDEKRRYQYKLDCENVKKRASGKSILDIGCGLGLFLDEFDDSWFKLGIEPSNYASAVCTKKHICILEPDQVIPGVYDVVVLRGTLQHIYNPIETLDLATRALRSGGLLAILATPNTDSLGYLRWGTLPALDAPRNWIPFGKKMLKNILNRLDYREIDITLPYGKPYANPVKDLYKFIIGKPTAFPGNMMDVYAWKR